MTLKDLRPELIFSVAELECQLAELRQQQGKSKS